MKQKFTLIKNEEQKKLIIKEYAELDKGILSLLCEEAYDAEAVTDAISRNTEALIAVLRTKNMYPPSAYMDQIAEAVVSLYESDSVDTKDLLLNDMDVLLPPEVEEPAEVEDTVEDDGDIDDLLDDDKDDDDLDEKLEIKKLKTSLKIADAEPEDSDDD